MAPDTHGYVRLAHSLAQWQFADHDGRRTPGYPLLVVFADFDFERVWLIQSALGTAIALLVFFLVYRRTRQRGWALAAGLVYGLGLNQLCFESSMVTETLSAFLVALSFALVLEGVVPTSAWRALALGFVVAFAGLTRPLFFLLAPIYLAVLLLRRVAPRGTAARLLAAAAFLAPVTVAFLGWSAVNLRSTGVFAPTTLTGYNLTNHSGAFIEDAAPEYAAIREVYLRFRQQRAAETGSHTMAIWDAIPEMMEESGLSFGELSRRLTAMSLDLFARHPLPYARGVFDSAVRFWGVASYDWFGEVASPSTRTALEAIWRLERFALLILNAAFLALIAHALLRRGLFSLWRDESAAVVIVLSACIVQALLERGENARYAVPFTPLVVYATAVLAASLRAPSTPAAGRR